MLIVMHVFGDGSGTEIYEATSVSYNAKTGEVLLMGTPHGMQIMKGGEVSVATVMGAEIATYDLESNHEEESEGSVAGAGGLAPSEP